jgi:hypothetical protein
MSDLDQAEGPATEPESLEPNLLADVAALSTLISGIVSGKGTLEAKRDFILNALTEDDADNLDEFCSWFAHEEPDNDDNEGEDDEPTDGHAVDHKST